MFNLNYGDNRFNLIWCECAIFVIGFEKGLCEWRRLLTEKGYVVVSELSWLQNGVPEQAVTFMKQAYPVINTIDENLEVAQKSRYRVVDSFLLPSKSWWDNYYDLIEAKLPSVKAKYKDDKDALQFLAFDEMEIEMFRKYSDYYGYVIYILQIK